MSIIPIYNASFVGLLLLGLFMWKTLLLSVVFLCIIISIVLYVYESTVVVFHYESAFWLFILREVIVFGTLLICCLYFDVWYYANLSRSLEIPFLGCFVLLGSSITVTGFHHLLGWRWDWVLLLFTVILGVSFVGLQLFEMDEIFMNIFDTRFHARSFCTVGLHFSHVLLGVIGLSTILFVGVYKFGVYRCTVMAWYWHFVDYVWLFVYTFVYVCYY